MSSFQDQENYSDKTADPYALHLELHRNSFFIGSRELCHDDLIDDIRKEVFYQNAKEVQDFNDPDCLHVFLRHAVDFAGETWSVCLIFQNGEFRDLWLEHAKLMQQRSMLKNASSNPRLRKNRVSLFSKLMKKLDDMAGKRGETTSDRGNQQYIYSYDDHSVMLVQDNNMPTIVIYIQYYKPKETEEKDGNNR